MRQCQTYQIPVRHCCYKLKSTIECNGEIFRFLLNESEFRAEIGSRTTTTITTIEEHTSEQWWYNLFNLDMWEVH